MIKPYRILGFLVFVLLLLAGISLIFPEKPIEIGKISLKYPKLNDVFSASKIDYVDIDKIVDINSDIAEDSIDENFLDSIAVADSIARLDSLIRFDTIRADADFLAASEYPVINSEQGQKKLYDFFHALERARYAERPVRIMHYGDSQIEADHITGYLRERLQKTFGGKGPGLIEIKPVTQKLSWRMFPAEEWKRFTLFGKVDTSINHKRYGAMLSLFRFAPPWIDSLPNDSIVYASNFRVKNSKNGYALSNWWDKARLFYGNLHRSVNVQISNETGEIILQDSLLPVSGLSEITLTTFSNEFQVDMSGYDSPDVYAISLESNHGVIVDNIPLRGSAGTIFTVMEYSMLQKWLSTLNTKLLLLQFGVNVVSDEIEDFTYYENRMFYQLNTIAKMRPDIAVIVIGVSDMSKKDGTNYVSYDAIHKIRDAQKNAAMHSGFSFWDMYEAMGGENSMPSWVWADPPLANQDFTHFNVRGSKIISNMLYNALMLEYRNYQQTQKISETQEEKANED